MALKIGINLNIGPNADDFAELLEDVATLRQLVPEANAFEANAILNRIEERAMRLRVWVEKEKPADRPKHPETK